MAGPVHGIRPDGRVDVSAAEAWPDAPPLSPLTPQELGTACSTFAACEPVPVFDAGAPGQIDYPGRWQGANPPPDNVWTEMLMRACLSGAVLPLSVSAGERRIPISYANESFPFWISGVLATGGDCSRIATLLTKDDGLLQCQEDGCWSSSALQVRCEGDVTVLGEARRDCSRSETHCSETSPTGCTDRPLVRCESGAMDRCDGSVKLGCDGCGYVSFHECAWDGGRCVETPDGAACQPPGADAGAGAAPAVDGGTR